MLSQQTGPSAQDGCRKCELESEDEDGDPRRLGNITSNATINMRWAMVERVLEGGIGGGGSAGGAGSLVVFVNVDVDNFPIPPLTVAS